LATARNIAWQIYRVLIAVTAAACVVQIFLAGRGVFGIHGSTKLDDQKSLDAHRVFGEIIGIGTLVVFVLALIMCNKRLIIWTFVLALLAEVVQHATATPSHRGSAACTR
jgi:Mn2+/Fe2+ NRAMP family transporter